MNLTRRSTLGTVAISAFAGCSSIRRSEEDIGNIDSDRAEFDLFTRADFSRLSRFDISANINLETAVGEYYDGDARDEGIQIIRREDEITVKGGIIGNGNQDIRETKLNRAEIVDLTLTLELEADISARGGATESKGVEMYYFYIEGVQDINTVEVTHLDRGDTAMEVSKDLD